MGLIGTHLIPACVDHGLTVVTAAGLLAATGVFAVIGGTASGWLSDRFDNRCVHHLEMTPVLPFRDVTVAGFGRRAARSLCEAQRPADVSTI